MASIYSATYMAKLSKLHSQIQNLKKSGLSALEYINKLKNLCNKLVAIGESMSYTDHVLYHLRSLGRDYNPFVTSITNRPDKPPIEKFHSLLLGCEFRIDVQNLFEKLSFLQANFSQLNTPSKSYKSPYFSQFKIDLLQIMLDLLLHKTINMEFLENPKANKCPIHGVLHSKKHKIHPNFSVKSIIKLVILSTFVNIDPTSIINHLLVIQKILILISYP